MATTSNELRKLFHALDAKIDEINRLRREDGLIPLKKAKVQLLGQMSLMVDEGTSRTLHLSQTVDMDALLRMAHVAKEEFKTLLKVHGYVYDEDSPLIWIPKGSEFLPFINLAHVVVESIDPESALVSKAVKDPAKNKQLIRQAIVSDQFPDLVRRIIENGGSLEDFT